MLWEGCTTPVSAAPLRGFEFVHNPRDTTDYYTDDDDKQHATQTQCQNEVAAYARPCRVAQHGLHPLRFEELPQPPVLEEMTMPEPLASHAFEIPN